MDSPDAVTPVVPPPYVGRPLRLRPFRGISLSPSRVGDPASARLFARPYSDVGSRIGRWEERGRLSRTAQPAVYLHEYTSGQLTIRGFVGALDISHRAQTPADRAVLPHEGIHPEQAEELAARMSEFQVNPAPILLVHRAHDSVRELVTTVTQRAPDRQFSDRTEQRHRLWSIRDTAQLATLDAGLAQSRALIADGHHRYAAYLRMQQQAPGSATDRGLAMLVDQGDTPLFLGAIHRELMGVSLADLVAAARRIGARTQEGTRADTLSELGGDTVVATDGGTWVRLHLDLSADRAAVEELHDALLPALSTPPTHVRYHHSVEDALRPGGARAGVTVLMPAPDFDLVLRITAAGRLLPEKATSFQPKPNIGVLIRSLADE